VLLFFTAQVMRMSLIEKMPILYRHSGVWDGFYRYYDADGNKTDEHKSRLLCRFPDEDTYHQTNYYFWENGETEIRDFPTRIENNKIIFYTEIQGWAAEVPLDEHSRTVMLYWVRPQEDDLHLYEMIQISDCGNYRNRVWQWFKNGRLFQRTLIDEQFVSKDWQDYQQRKPLYADIAVFD
jgi:hypothetical protein